MHIPSTSTKITRITTIEQGVRLLQLIVVALIMGVLMFAGVAVFLTFQQGPQVPLAPGAPPKMVLIAYLAVGFAMLVTVVRFVVPGIVLNAGVKQAANNQGVDQLTPVDLLPSYIASTIVACALLEGAALFNVVALIIDSQVWSLGIVGVLLVLMAVNFPTVDRVQYWADDQIRQLKMGGLH